MEETRRRAQALESIRRAEERMRRRGVNPRCICTETARRIYREEMAREGWVGANEYYARKE